MRFAITSRRIVTPIGVRETAVVVEAGKIADVVERGRVPRGFPVDEVGDLVVTAGLVDPHVHVNEPGRTEWEGFETATRAAAAGGITTILDMPLNSDPPTTTVAALEAKLAVARPRLHVDVAFCAGLVPGNLEEIEPLADAGVSAAKAFLVDSGIAEFPPVAEVELRAAMPVLARRGVPLLVHAEIDRAPSGSQPGSRVGPWRRYADYVASRPPRFEVDAVDLLVRLCRQARCPVHVVHLSSAQALASIREARAQRLPLTAETCPHYLTFAAEEIPDGDTRFKCAPPIRDARNRESLWGALAGGEIDLVASDHSPCPPERKRLAEGDFKAAWGGISSLQLLLPALWTEARLRGASLEDLAAWTSLRAARLLGLEGRKGAIAQGCDADLVVWDPEASFRVEPAGILHRHRLTPYEGRTLYGRVRRTYLRGVLVCEDGRAIGEPRGEIVLRGAARARD
jgi:allantoinase